MFAQMLNRLGWWMHTSRDNAEKRSQRIWFHRQDDRPPRDSRKLYITRWNLELYWFRLKFDWGLEFRMEDDCEGTFGLRIAIPFILTFYLSLDARNYDWVEKITGQYESRTWGWRVNTDAAQLMWRKAGNGWGADTSKYGHSWYFSWDRLKGKCTYTATKGEIVVRTFTQPAFKSRPASEHQMTLTRTTWRWTYANPFVKTIERVGWDVSFENGQTPPSFSGKGENSYDCDDDAIWGTSFDVATVGEAVLLYIAKVTEQRQRYG